MILNAEEKRLQTRTAATKHFIPDSSLSHVPFGFSAICQPTSLPELSYIDRKCYMYESPHSNMLDWQTFDPVLSSYMFSDTDLCLQLLFQTDDFLLMFGTLTEVVRTFMERVWRSSPLLRLFQCGPLLLFVNPGHQHLVGLLNIC